MKTVRPFRFALLAAALAMAGAAAAKEGPLDGVSRQFEDLIRSADTQALAAMYAEDAVVMPPNHAPVKGRADIAALFKGYTDAGFTLKLTPAATWMDGALAVRSGSYVLLDKEQKEAEHGKWMEAWRKGEDGNWLMVRDMWNSDDPQPPPPTTGVSSDKE